MKRTILLLISAFFFALLVNSAQASLSDVVYPVPELGNCNSQAECEVYCDDTTHIEECINFAEKNNLMSKEEIAEVRKVMPFIKQGQTPGGCKGQKECDAYCDDDAHFNDCVEFAKKAGLISDDEYEIVKKTGGKGPGGCKGQKECDEFCNNDANFDVCIEFAKQYGLISAEDYERAKKTGGKGPGGCKKEECDEFCNKEENLNICVDFAVEHGMMSAEEGERAKKSRGKGPGGCKSEEECNTYCKNNMEECKKWEEEQGIVREQNERGGEGGPGGCKSEEECKAYCENKDNLDSCLRWSVDNGKMSQEEYDKIMEQNRKAAEGPPPDTSTPPMEWEEPQEGQPSGSPTEGDSGGTGSGTDGSGGGSGGDIGGSGGGDSGSSGDSGGGGSGSSDSGSSSGGGESAPTTGSVIYQGDSNTGLFIDIIRFIFGI